MDRRIRCRQHVLADVANRYFRTQRGRCRANLLVRSRQNFLKSRDIFLFRFGMIREDDAEYAILLQPADGLHGKSRLRIATDLAEAK